MARNGMRMGMGTMDKMSTMRMMKVFVKVLMLVLVLMEVGMMIEAVPLDSEGVVGDVGNGNVYILDVERSESIVSHLGKNMMIKGARDTPSLTLSMKRGDDHLTNYHSANFSTARARMRRNEQLNNLTLHGYPAVAYHIELEFGQNGEGGVFRCIVDTGSSNLAISADVTDNAASHFKDTATTQRESSTFQVSYVVSSWIAQRVRDHVSFTEDHFLVEDIEFGAITSSKDFFPANSAYDGILGMAYSSIARPLHNPVEPFLDSLVRLKNFANIFATKICVQLPGPLNVVPYTAYGTMTLGSDDIGLVFPDLVYAHIQEATYYSVVVTQLAVGNTIIDADCAVYNSPFYSIVDSGTTDIIVPKVIHDQVIPLIDATLNVPSLHKDDFYNGQYCMGIDSALVYGGLPDFTISILSAANATEHFHLRVPSYRYLRYSVDANNDVCYVFSIVPIDGDTGITIGISVLSGFVVSFDRERNRIGFATSSCAGYGHGVDIRRIPVPEPLGFDSSKCYPEPLHQKDISSLWVYVTLGIGCAILIILAVLVVKNILKWRHRRIAGRSMAMPDIPGVNVDDADDGEYVPQSVNVNRNENTAWEGNGRHISVSSQIDVEIENARKAARDAAQGQGRNSGGHFAFEREATAELVITDHSGSVNFDYGMPSSTAQI